MPRKSSKAPEGRKETLTDKAIAAFAPAEPGKRYIVNDIVVPGLGVRITESGHKTYVLGKRFPGSDNFKRVELAEVGAMTLADVRDKARDWLRMIKAGEDPRLVEAKKKAEAERAAAIANSGNYLAVQEAYIARHQSAKRQGATVASRLRHEVEPIWKNKSIHDITRSDVKALVTKIKERPAPAYARNVFDDIRALFGWVVNHEDEFRLEHSPCDHIDTKKLLGAKRIGQRVLDDKELVALWNVSGDFPYGTLHRAIMLTGVRRDEMAEAIWSEFDFEAKTFTVPSERFKKRGEEEVELVVPLSPAMLELLEQIPNNGPSSYLFSKNDGLNLIRSFPKDKRKRVAAMAAELGFTPKYWDFHDLRRTMRSKLAELEVLPHVAELVIGHSKKGMEAIYNKYQYRKEIAAALTLWAAHLTELVNPTPPKQPAVADATVVNLAEKRVARRR